MTKGVSTEPWLVWIFVQTLILNLHFACGYNPTCLCGAEIFDSLKSSQYKYESINECILASDQSAARRCSTDIRILMLLSLFLPSNVFTNTVQHEKKKRRIISTIVKKHHSFINHAATLGFLAKQKKKWNTLQLGFNTLDLTGKTRWPVLRKQMLQLPCYRQIVYSDCSSLVI